MSASLEPYCREAWEGGLGLGWAVVSGGTSGDGKGVVGGCRGECPMALSLLLLFSHRFCYLYFKGFQWLLFLFDDLFATHRISCCRCLVVGSHRECLGRGADIVNSDALVTSRVRTPTWAGARTRGW